MEIAAITALTLLGLLAVFQAILVCGMPLGRFAWGGQYEVLPRKLRIGSAVAIGIYALFAAFITSKVGFWQIVPSGTALNIGLWVIAAYLALGTVANLLSRSKPERYTITPVTLILFICVLVVANS